MDDIRDLYKRDPREAFKEVLAEIDFDELQSMLKAAKVTEKEAAAFDRHLRGIK